MKDKPEKRFLIIIKTRGKFYNVNGDDAYIIHRLLGYKVLDSKKCGFPDSAINRVINKLEENKISYQIIETNKDPVIKDFKKINNYNKAREEALKSLDAEERINNIVDKIKLATESQLEEILSYIEKCLE